MRTTRAVRRTPNCTFDATVFMDWGSRPTGPDATFEATIEVDGSAARTLTGPTPQGNWTAAQVPDQRGRSRLGEGVLALRAPERIAGGPEA